MSTVTGVQWASESLCSSSNVSVSTLRTYCQAFRVGKLARVTSLACTWRPEATREQRASGALCR
eukprot:scaffold49163_cov37-Prasinocladus_malaysianus.AAC.2